MIGYRDRRDTAEALIELDGVRWLRSGDLRYVDADGSFFIVGWLECMINSSGYKIWPAECEIPLYSHPAVAECAVIAAPGGRRGEMVLAVLNPDRRGTVGAGDIIGFARARIAAYKVLREVGFRDSLPRSGGRTIDWALLAELWERH